MSEWAENVIENAYEALGTTPGNQYGQAENQTVYEGNRAILCLLSGILRQLMDVEKEQMITNAHLAKLRGGDNA